MWKLVFLKSFAIFSSFVAVFLIFTTWISAQWQSAYDAGWFFVAMTSVTFAFAVVLLLLCSYLFFEYILYKKRSWRSSSLKNIDEPKPDVISNRLPVVNNVVDKVLADMKEQVSDTKNVIMLIRKDIGTIQADLQKASDDARYGKIWYRSEKYKKLQHDIEKLRKELQPLPIDYLEAAYEVARHDESMRGEIELVIGSGEHNIDFVMRQAGAMGLDTLINLDIRKQIQSVGNAIRANAENGFIENGEPFLRPGERIGWRCYAEQRSQLDQLLEQAANVAVAHSAVNLTEDV